MLVIWPDSCRGIGDCAAFGVHGQRPRGRRIYCTLLLGYHVPTRTSSNESYITAYLLWSLGLSSSLSSHTKEVISPLLTPTDLLPSQPGYIHDTHILHIAPPWLFCKPAPQFPLIDILAPFMRASGHNPKDILCDYVGDQPACPRPRDRAHYEPTTGLHMR